MAGAFHWFRSPPQGRVYRTPCTSLPQALPPSNEYATGAGCRRVCAPQRRASYDMGRPPYLAHKKGGWAVGWGATGEERVGGVGSARSLSTVAAATVICTRSFLPSSVSPTVDHPTTFNPPEVAHMAIFLSSTGSGHGHGVCMSSLWGSAAAHRGAQGQAPASELGAPFVNDESSSTCNLIVSVHDPRYELIGPGTSSTTASHVLGPRSMLL